MRIKHFNFSGIEYGTKLDETLHNYTVRRDDGKITIWDKDYCDEIVHHVTIWSRYNVEKREYQYNHYEDGINVEDKPAPKSETQKIWNKYSWKKEYGLLEDGEIKGIQQLLNEETDSNHIKDIIDHVAGNK